MKVRIVFYLVCVVFGLACCGVVPSNFKSPHDEHMHAEEILSSSGGPNASIPILENSESRNASRSFLVDHHQLNTSEVLVSDFHNVSDLNHVQHSIPEEDISAKKIPKGSDRSKKKSPRDSTRFVKPSQGEIDHAIMNDTHHHGLVDDHASEPHHLQIDHKSEDSKIHGLVEDHSSAPHHLRTDNKTEDLKIQGSINVHSSEHHHLQTDHKTEDPKNHSSVDDHFLEHQLVQKQHKAGDAKIHDSVDDHSLESHHLKLDHKSDYLGFHGIVENDFSELDHAPGNFSHTDKNVTKGIHIENTTAHFDEEPEHPKDFATTFDDMLKIPEHELDNKEKYLINQKIDNESHTEDTKHDSNNLNEFSKISHSDNLINSEKNLTPDWNNTNQETKNVSINNNLRVFSNAVEDVTHDSATNLSQDNLKDPVAALSSELINSVIDFTNNTDHANKDHVNDFVVVRSNELTKSVNEAHNNVLEDLKSVPRNTSEFKNDSHDPPKTTESTQEHFNHADNTKNLLKSTVASITNSKLFLNIHNSFMRINPTDKHNSAKLKHEETSENVISVSDDLTASQINGENSNKPSSTDAIFQEVNTLDIKEDIPSPSSTVSGISVTKTENEDKFSSEHTEKVLVDPKPHNKSISINIETKSVNAVENSTSQVLFSSLGLEFLMNSELAKNAASAMEIFNFTDSALTDHIIDDQNDMHDLLDIRSSVVDDHNFSNSESNEQINSNLDADSSTFNTDSSTLVTGSSKLDTESSTLVMESSSVVYISDEVSEVNNNLKETFVEVIDSSSELSDGNESIEAFTTTTLNTELANVTMVSTVFLNSTAEFQATTNTAQPDARNVSDVAGEGKCPPPGICIFWFFAQDTCTINSHCLGSRICCRIGCSKTCVEF